MDIHAIPELARLRLVECEFKVSLGYVARTYFKETENRVVE